MLDVSGLKNLLNKKGLSQTDALLLILASGGGEAKKHDEITATAIAAGVRGIKKWNVSARLSASGGKAIKTPNGWEVTDAGRTHITDKLSVDLGASPMGTAASRLSKHLPKVTNAQTRTFLDEAVVCLQHGHRRAAVVLSWVGAVSLLQEYVVKNRLTDFNSAAGSRPQQKRGWKPATVADDISSRMEEYEFLQVCHAISLFGKNVKNRLEQALKLRNGAGHPNQLAVEEFEAAAHVEALVKNVFEKFTV
ncbi:hypothetical protein EPN44_05875 [bacterium]|nr:MAG: hypothetical protein EPN44_05875 [bacterium]